MNNLINIEAEQQTLGGLLLMGQDNHANIKHIISLINGVNAFYGAKHKQIFTSIKTLVDENKPVDLITVLENLKQQKSNIDFDDLEELTDLTASYANIKIYIKMINLKYYKRDFYALKNEFEKLRAEQTDEQEGFNLIENFKIKLNALAIKHLDKKNELSNNAKVDNHLHCLDKRLMNSKDGINGIATGIKSLDNKLHGLRPGQLIVIAGQSSSGKSALALNIAKEASFNQDKKTLLFSLEMQEEELMDRLIASDQHIPIKDLQSGEVINNNEQYNKININFRKNFAQNNNLLIADKFLVTLEQIKEVANHQLFTDKLDLIVIDYLQLIKAKNARTRAEEIATITRELKILANQLNVPIILLSQLSREVAKRTDNRPLLSDLKESSSIEQDADIVLFVYRENQYNTNYNGTTAELIIRKARNAETGTVYADYLGQFFLFKSIDEPNFTPNYPAKSQTINKFSLTPTKNYNN